VQLTDTPVGYAAENGGTVGGGDATPIMVTTPEALKMYLADTEPRVLYLMNDLDFRTERRGGVMTCNENDTCDNGSGEQIDEPRVSATCDPNEHAGTSYRYELRLDVTSNKTLIGVGDGSGVTIYGSSLNLDGASQVIFRNFTLRDINPHLIEAGDGITLNNSEHVWLDHLLLTEISDGYVDIGSPTAGASDVTLSWIRFSGKTPHECGGQHSYVNFADNVNATYHHNFFDNCGGRNPKIGESATVHLFNNYWLNISYFCITAQSNGAALVESNYFESSQRPHWLQEDGKGIAIDDGNVYTGASNGKTNRDAGGSAFSVSYTYAKQTAEAAKADILRCAGPQPIR
jgi:pectate lyase